MGDEERITGIEDTGIDRVDQTQRSIHLPQQQGSSIRGQPAAAKVGLDVLAFEACKQQGSGGTVCHGNGLSVWVLESSQLLTLPAVRPFVYKKTPKTDEICGLRDAARIINSQS
jgi:hypothetical protein